MAVAKPLFLPIKPMPAPLILASTSIFRRALLERLRIPFEVASPGVDESHLPREAPRDRALRLALAKAEAIATRRPESVVIGSDQVAICGDTVLDKPGDAAGCQRQLAHLSGRSATFHTAVAVLGAERGLRDCFVDVTELQFRRLSSAEIDRYIALDQPFQCAGSFRSEALGVSLFERMDSHDPTGLVGLPLIRLAQSLRAAGYALP
jgi:septum formation protein